MMSSRNLLLSVAAACFAVLGAAMYLQHGLDLLPCPLCVIQRYLFLAVAVACLAGAAAGKPKLGAGLGLLAALGGLGVAGKHLYVLAHPGLSCGIDPMETMLNKIVTAEYLPFMFRADGLCEDATMPFFGLSIPQWSLVCFGLFALATLWLLARRK
ncbi:disulfide bond formation protein B [Janthinobacterium fluminis]|uniref:Disulfide bond formation protein B n=1 Tax=Janthinobacterium fluminis TaxID=2987524 RepID=A0ABT5K1T7_9BURK|nr:disulfide bond formation protein B [Janthinobacterium fluminis]MDC8757722.1 disulfide bond formation protein B [Janthinobacterium fluminis]